MTVGRPQKENFYLKQEFTTYLQGRDLAPATIKENIRELALFLAWIDKEEIQITKPDILKYLEHLKNKRNLQNITRARILIALNHYFNFLTQQQAITQNPCLFLKIRGTQKRTLLRLYTPEELTELYDNFYMIFVQNLDDSHIPPNVRQHALLSKQRNAVILSILIYQGVSTKEIDFIQLCDVDLRQAKLKIRGGLKIGKERILPLQATQIGGLMYYLQTIRPQLLEYHSEHSNKLFLPLPFGCKPHTQNTTVSRVFSPLKKQLKTLDKHFVNFAQIRASVITYWIQTEGLRKAQYKAGHRYISSTEKHLINDLQQLTDDITKLHPF